MDWATFAMLMAKYSFELAAKLQAKWEEKGIVTKEEVAELRAELTQTALDRAKARLVAAGIPLDSDKAKEFLALVV